MHVAVNRAFLAGLGVAESNPGAATGAWHPTHGAELVSYSPVDEQAIGRVRLATVADYEAVVRAAQEAFATWRTWPAPKRGEVVRQLGNACRDHKSELAMLIAYEMGKITSEAEGEVQEMIDIADYAVGLSRQLYGKTMHSERPQHRM
jgi:aldehyde dehydrogenase (NAD+)